MSTIWKSSFSKGRNAKYIILKPSVEIITVNTICLKVGKTPDQLHKILQQMVEKDLLNKECMKVNLKLRHLLTFSKDTEKLIITYIEAKEK